MGQQDNAGRGDGLRPTTPDTAMLLPRTHRPSLSTDPASLGPTDPASLLETAPRRAEPSTKGELYKSFGDSYTRAFELAVTPVIFGAMGYGLDSWLGIVPVLTMLFSLVALLGLMARTWYGYVSRMQALEQEGPWANRPKPPQEKAG